MLTKNQVYEAPIVDYTAEGQGIAKIDGCAVFVPNAIVGELCRIRIEKARPTIGSTVPAPWPSSAAAVISGTWITKKRPV